MYNFILIGILCLSLGLFALGCGEEKPEPKKWAVDTPGGTLEFENDGESFSGKVERK